MIHDRSLQRALADLGHSPGAIDGIFGQASRRAARGALAGAGIPFDAWPDSRLRIAAEQLVMRAAGIETGAIDGLAGPQTRFAWERWQDRLRDRTPPAADVAHQPRAWPRQKDVPAFFGEPGVNQKLLALPFPMRLAWDKATTVTRISLHAKVHDSAARAFARTLAHYGRERIAALGLDLFGGALNVRRMRGGSAMSMHSWGIAIDFDPERNQLRWGRDRARMAGSEYAAFFDIWEAEGWIGLGRETNRDWMHIQAARL